MKLIQNILKIAFILLFLPFENTLQSSALNIELKDLFSLLQENNKKPFIIDSVSFTYNTMYGVGTSGERKELLHNTVKFNLQKIANAGLYCIPKDLGGIVEKYTHAPPLGKVNLTIEFTMSNQSYKLSITSNHCSVKRGVYYDGKGIWNIQDYYGTNDPSIGDSYLITDLNQIENTTSTLPAIPSSGPITLDTLDAYLKTFSTTPTFKIKNGCWYGAASYDPSKLTDIVQQSLQQHADKVLLAFPANMNQYFGKDPRPNLPKFLHIKFTMDAVNYSITIPENNAFSPKSKYLYKIPAGTTNPLLSIQQTSETPEDLTEYLAQFDTKEKIEADIKRIKKQKDDMIWAREHIGMTETVLIKFNAKMDEFNAKIKALQDKLATIQVPSQPDPSSPWPPAGAITFAQLKTILETNNQKPFKIIKAVYGAPGGSFTVSDKLQVAADSGTLYIPQNMNAAFGDPIGGVKKNLDIIFAMNQQEYKLTLGETWFASSPEWFKQPNQYITFEQTAISPEPKPDPSSPWPPAGAITLAQLKTILEVNNKKPFKITEAVYGAPGKSFTVSDKLQVAADSGQLYIPQNMNAAFGDPIGGVKKNLDIIFTMNQQEYKLTLGETWFASSPEWFKQPNQYILLKQTTTSPEPKPDPSSPWPPAGAITLAQLKTILEINNKKPFKFLKITGYYNTLKTQLMDSPSIQKARTAFFQDFANRGLFINPFALESFDHNIYLGIIFEMNAQRYSIKICDPNRPDLSQIDTITRDDFLASCKDLIIQYQ